MEAPGAERPKHGPRYEIKFLLDRARHQALLGAIHEQLQLDPHSDDGCQYLVRSLYYDTADHKAYWDKVNGYRFRRKIRLRLYGDRCATPSAVAYLEIKERVGTQMNKRRIQVRYGEATAFAQLEQNAGRALSEPGLGVDFAEANEPTVQELRYLFSALQLQPACVVSYQRRAFAGHVDYPDLRVTFDTNVCCRANNLTLLHADRGGTQTLLEPGWSILEIKVNQTIPYWLAQILGEQGCAPRRISKYCASLERTETIRRRQHIEMLTQ